jgi:hypothetical protein
VEGSFAWFAVAVGEVQVDSVAVDGDQRCALDGLVAGEIGKCHVSNLGGESGSWAIGINGGNRIAAARVVLGG